MKLVAIGALAWLLAAGVAAAQTPDPLKGDWYGVLDGRLHLALHFGERVTLDSLDQGSFGAAGALAPGPQSGSYVVTLPSNVTYEFTLTPEGALNGTFHQNGGAAPLVFTRQGPRPQTPRPPFPYRSVDVAYDNPAQPGVHLAGTLTLPPGDGPFPAVVLITGSGTEDRDETIFGHKTFLLIADALTRKGLAVLRVDDRGAGGSTGAYPDMTLRDEASDVAAGLAFLRARRDIDGARIGLLGHSEGGVIAPMVAQTDGRISFLVFLGGPSVKGRDLSAFQAGQLMRDAGAPAAALEASASRQRQYLDIVEIENKAQRISALRTFFQGQGLSGAALETQVAQSAAEGVHSMMSQDPAPLLQTLKVPVLALYGGKDTQVPPALNEGPMRQALAGDAQAQVTVLPGLNHLLQTAGTGSLGEYPTIEETMAPAALNLIADWVAQQALRH